MSNLVVLVHGLARTHRSMARMARHLGSVGFEVANWNYSSRRYGLFDLIEHLGVHVASLDTVAKSVHFVGHSLGGIIARGLLAGPCDFTPGRLVMIGSPNQGTRVADRLGHNALFRLYYGPVLAELGTAPDATVHQLGVPDVEIGVIAGSLTFHIFNPGSYFAAIIHETAVHDGTVEAERTKISGMRDYVLVPLHHTFICQDDDVIRQTTAFLNRGAFDREGATA